MYATPDGATTLTATLNYIDDPALSMGAAFQQANQQLIQAVFGQAR
jgi:D-alanyl-D-alanine carboxypeptidase